MSGSGTSAQENSSSGGIHPSGAKASNGIHSADPGSAGGKGTGYEAAGGRRVRVILAGAIRVAGRRLAGAGSPRARLTSVQCGIDRFDIFFEYYSEIVRQFLDIMLKNSTAFSWPSFGQQAARTSPGQSWTLLT
jgi:hypothetical protein